MFHLARGRGQELMKHISKGPGAIFPLEKISLGGCVAINDQQSTDIPSKDRRRACGWANADREIPPVVQEVFQVEARAERPSYWPARIEMSSRESTYQPFHVVTYGEEPCKKLQINLRMELLQITYK